MKNVRSGYEYEVNYEKTSRLRSKYGSAPLNGY